MLQSFALQNSNLNFKSTKHENVTHFINGRGTSIHANKFKLKNLHINLRNLKGLFSAFIKTVGRKIPSHWHIAMWKSKTRVTSYELHVQIHELRVQINGFVMPAITRKMTNLKNEILAKNIKNFKTLSLIL